ncbi:MAG: hypothetical protein GY952_09600 [Rhodobacteraceae bacterium]|nr:hypothetical protein [Paracoccaceae bacterium]
MLLQLRFFLLFSFAMSFATAAFPACQAARFTTAQKAVIATGSPNQALFTDAVTRALAAHLCKAGRNALATDKHLIKTARLHSKNMARLHKFSHKLPVAGQKTVAQRARKAGVNWHFLAENIARLSRYQFQANRRFQILNASRCQFANPASGKSIPPHSYASLALAVSAQWMASSGHRKNILNRNSKHMGAAVVFDASGPNCGHFYITQVFSD